MGLNSATSCGAVRYIITPMLSAITTEAMIPKREPFFARSWSPAPRFCPTKVVSDIVKLITGRNAKPSSLEYAPYAAIATLPKALMFDCTMTFAKPITEFCTPDGRP